MKYGTAWLFRKTKALVMQATGRQRLVVLLGAISTVVLYFLSVKIPVEFGLIAFSLYAILFAVVLLSNMNDEKATTGHLIDERVKPMEGDLSRVKEDLEYAKLELKQRVDDLEEFIRSTLAGHDIVIPPMPVNLRARELSASGHVSAPQGVVGIRRDWKSRVQVLVSGVQRLARLLVVGNRSWLDTKDQHGEG